MYCICSDMLETADRQDFNSVYRQNGLSLAWKILCCDVLLSRLSALRIIITNSFGSDRIEDIKDAIRSLVSKSAKTHMASNRVLEHLNANKNNR